MHQSHSNTSLVIDKTVSVFEVHVLCLLQGSQEKQLSQASGFAEAVGVVSRSGASDVSAMEGGHRAAR